VLEVMYAFGHYEVKYTAYAKHNISNIVGIIIDRARHIYPPPLIICDAEWQ
jgi:hypothetical protein